MKELFGILSLVAGFCTFAPYFVEMAKRTARPHIYSWITWSMVTGVGFFVSLASGGGSGALIFGLQSALCIVVAIYAIRHGEKHITRLDRIAFASALAVTAFYIFTRQAVLSACLATIIDCLGYLPTFRKSFNAPQSEPALTYGFSGTGFLLSLFALSEVTFATFFYPAVLVVTNGSLVAFLLLRRRTLRARQSS